MDEEVAILMSTYNGEQYLADQIRSIIDQDYTNWHLYIRDDGSQDKTCNIIRSFSSNNSNITFINDDRIVNMGVAKSFMSLLKNTDADFYMFSDQDDVWKKNKVSDTLRLMKQFDYQNKPVSVYTNLQVVDSKLQGDEALLDNNWQDFLHLLFTNNAYGCTMMINDCLKSKVKFNMLDFSNIFMHDWWLMLIASAFGEVGYMDKKTIFYRQHGDNQVGASSKTISSYLKRILNPKRDRIALKRSINLAAEFLKEYSREIKDTEIANYVKEYGRLQKYSTFLNNWKLVHRYPPLSVHPLKQKYYGYLITVYHSDFIKKE